MIILFLNVTEMGSCRNIFSFSPFVMKADMRWGEFSSKNVISMPLTVGGSEYFYLGIGKGPYVEVKRISVE
jgi:hypothetical protein